MVIKDRSSRIKTGPAAPVVPDFQLMGEETCIKFM